MSTKPADLTKKMKESTFLKNAKQKKRDDLNHWCVALLHYWYITVDTLRIHSVQYHIAKMLKKYFIFRKVDVGNDKLKIRKMQEEAVGEFKVRLKHPQLTFKTIDIILVFLPSSILFIFTECSYCVFVCVSAKICC